MATPTAKKDNKKNQTGSGSKSNKRQQTPPPASEAVTPVVIKEIPLEKVIDNKLAENNVTKRVLTAMKDKFLAPAVEEGAPRKLKDEFILRDLNDKETYLIIKAERKNVRKVGIVAEDICEKGRADAIAIQKLWLGKQKEVLGEVATVQDLLDEQIEKYDAEQERLRIAEDERKDNQLASRQAELIKMGAVNANGCMNINDLSIENSNIREADDETYNETILPLFRMHYEKNEEKRVAEEKQKQKEKEEFDEKQRQLAEEKKEFEEKQKQFEQQQEAFKKQQQEAHDLKIKNRCLQLEALGMQFSLTSNSYAFRTYVAITKVEVDKLEDPAWEVALQNLKGKIEQAKADIQMKQERQTARSAQLSELGLIFKGTAYVFEDVNIPATDLVGMDDDTWSKLINTTTPIIADRKQKAKEREQEEENKRKMEELDKQSDKEKWAVLMTSLNNIVIPDFKSPAYKSKMQQLTAKMKEINAL